MKEVLPYLTFNGNCREAMKFYEKCFGGELFMMTFAESKMDVPESAKDRIIHAKLTKGKTAIMASDTMPGQPLQFGNNFSLAAHFDNLDEMETIFKTLSTGGKVTMALQKTFWAPSFGMLTDSFGVQWMFNLEQA